VRPSRSVLDAALAAFGEVFLSDMVGSFRNNVS
jgi:hypothetical protein